MDIIICGAGIVGRGIARQLADEGNNVTLIDESEAVIAEINNSLEVSALHGYPSHPPVLEKAGAESAEMIIAVTTSDEVNMVICQLAHSMFNVPLKIARIRHPNYLKAIGKELYQNHHLPIDYIISPEREVAEAIIHRLHAPGVMDYLPFARGELAVVEVRSNEDNPYLGKTLEALHQDTSLPMRVLGIQRDGKFYAATPQQVLLNGDEVFVVTDEAHTRHVTNAFGYNERHAERIIIMGGGNVGLLIARMLKDAHPDLNIKIIELFRERAEYVASFLPDVTVICGSALDVDILREANVDVADTVICVSNDDEANILSAVLSKRQGAKKTFTLINKGHSYEPLIAGLGIDVTINPREMTVSSILQHTRKGNIMGASSICGGKAEIIELHVAAASSIVGKQIHMLSLPADIQIGAILRHKELLLPGDEEMLMEDDILLIIMKTELVKQFDSIFDSKEIEYW